MTQEYDRDILSGRGSPPRERKPLVHEAPLPSLLEKARQYLMEVFESAEEIQETQLEAWVRISLNKPGENRRKKTRSGLEISYLDFETHEQFEIALGENKATFLLSKVKLISSRIMAADWRKAEEAGKNQLIIINTTNQQSIMQAANFLRVEYGPQDKT